MPATQSERPAQIRPPSGSSPLRDFDEEPFLIIAQAECKKRGIKNKAELLDCPELSQIFKVAYDKGLFNKIFTTEKATSPDSNYPRVPSPAPISSGLTEPPAQQEPGQNDIAKKIAEISKSSSKSTGERRDEAMAFMLKVWKQLLEEHGKQKLMQYDVAAREKFQDLKKGKKITLVNPLEQVLVDFHKLREIVENLKENAAREAKVIEAIAISTANAHRGPQEQQAGLETPVLLQQQKTPSAAAQKPRIGAKERITNLFSGYVLLPLAGWTAFTGAFVYKERFQDIASMMDAPMASVVGVWGAMALLALGVSERIVGKKRAMEAVRCRERAIRVSEERLAMRKRLAQFADDAHEQARRTNRFRKIYESDPLFRKLCEELLSQNLAGAYINGAKAQEIFTDIKNSKGEDVGKILLNGLGEDYALLAGKSK